MENLLVYILLPNHDDAIFNQLAKCFHTNMDLFKTYLFQLRIISFVKCRIFFDGNRKALPKNSIGDYLCLRSADASNGGAREGVHPLRGP